MKNTLTLFLLLIFQIFGFAQVQTYDFGRTYTDSLPQEFKLDVSQIRNRIVGTIPENFKEKEYQRRAGFMFSDQNALFVSNLMSTGDVYSDWMAFEKYLNNIFDEVIPDDFADKEAVHIYLLKNGGFNAFMTASGISCVNIGVFADIDDEATLAGILAHELAHFYLQHGVKRFIKSEKGEFRRGIFGGNKSSSQFSIANEAQADSLAMIWMEKSGYAVDAMIKAFTIMKERQDRALGLYKDIWEFKATTHPLPTSRLEELNKFDGKRDGAYFLVSESQFNVFKKKAKPEILKHLLEGFNYNACIEWAYKFHLEESNNAAYLYYLMEAIRRSCYLRPELWSENFITHRYFEVVEDSADKREKKKVENHLFEKSPKDYLGLSLEEIKKMEGAFYFEEEVKFVTNEQAFDFFFRVSQLFNEPECVLSNALSITKDDKIRAQELEKYLGYKDIKYRSFAKALLEGNISKSLAEKKMIVWSNLQTTIRQGKEDIPIRKEDWNAPNNLSLLFDTIMMEFPEADGVFLPDWVDNRLNDYKLLNELETFSFQSTVSKGQRTELHILDPRYWDALRKFGVNEIEFINCRYYESRKGEKTEAAYKEIIAKDYLDIFNEKKRTKYFEVFVTAIRSVEDGAMKVKFYGGDNKLNFKKQARPQIISLLKKRIKEMEEEAKKTDRRFRKN
ncbi:MAG: M48 family metallopeptidase [Saprospiraceae bacterium]